MLRKLGEHPDLARKDGAQRQRAGLARARVSFIAYLISANRFVSMPSRIAADFWHEFILCTGEYQRFCRSAFSTFMHHTPATVLGENRRINAGLRRV